ncbi:hypothetical protein C8J57DRAFT_1513167 [Mycena rebaudengoi]|nr:hypothetical protein C8J57DRAFT_1513167 [Mycena rebaudengoi]
MNHALTAVFTCTLESDLTSNYERLYDSIVLFTSTVSAPLGTVGSTIPAGARSPPSASSSKNAADAVLSKREQMQTLEAAILSHLERTSDTGDRGMWRRCRTIPCDARRVIQYDVRRAMRCDAMRCARYDDKDEDEEGDGEDRKDEERAGGGGSDAAALPTISCPTFFYVWELTAAFSSLRPPRFRCPLLPQRPKPIHDDMLAGRQSMMDVVDLGKEDGMRTRGGRRIRARASPERERKPAVERGIGGDGI